MKHTALNIEHTTTGKKYVTVKQIKEEVLNKYLLLNTYAEHKKLYFPSGKAVFDLERGMVVRQVSNNYKLITNEDLVRWIKSDYSVKFLDIYKTKSQDTVYIEGYIPEFSYTDSRGRQFFISFEIANSYSSRFLPAIYLGLLYPAFPFCTIKTSVRVTPNSRKNLLDIPFNPDLINGILDFIQSDRTYNIIETLIEKAPHHLPKKLYPISLALSVTQNHRQLPIGYLELCAKIAYVWKETAYELSRAYQMQQYSYLIERISDDNNKQK